MFVKCPRCHSLIATDAVTGEPPEYCPYCDGPLAEATDPDLADTELAHDDSSDTATAVEISENEPSLAEADASETTQSDEISDAAFDETATEVSDTMAAASIVPDEAAATTTAPSGGTNASEKAEEDASETAQPSSPPSGNVDIDATQTDRGESATTSAASEKSATPKRRKRAAPSFVRRPSHMPRRPTPRWLWALAAVLALLAGLQILFADRAQLAADARWRPTLASACEVLHCTIPPWREPAAFTMLGRDVRQHPYMPGALRVDATFRNNARWPQPWPDLVLTLSDINGRALGMRTFSPKEYLDTKVTQKEIAAGQSAAIRMDVMEPAAGVVSFSFDFD